MTTVMTGTLFVPMYSNSPGAHGGERYWYTLNPEWSEEKAIAALIGITDADRMTVMRLNNMAMYEAHSDLQSLQLIDAEEINYGETSTGRHGTSERVHAEENNSGTEVSCESAGDDIQRVDSHVPEPVYSGRTTNGKNTGGEAG